VRQRFAAEFNAATRVRHPSLAMVFTHGEIRGRPAIAMEYVEGKSLEQLLLEQAPLPFELIDAMATQLIDVLTQIHAAEIIHRDVSPANIIVGKDDQGNPRFTLLDFGVASIAQGNLKTQGPIGTPRYMAPEQIDGQACLRSDVYSLGAILWWALTGVELHAEIKHLGDLIRRHTRAQAAPDLRSALPGAPRELCVLLAQVLAPHARRRPMADILARAWPRVARLCRGMDGRPGTLNGLPNDLANSMIGISEVTTQDPPLTTMSRAQANLRTPMGMSFDPVIVDALNALAPEEFQAVSNTFLVELPEQLMDLEDALEQNDGPKVDLIIRTIRNHARLVGGRFLIRLCDIVHQLDDPDYLDQRLGLVEEMSQEYQRICRYLIAQRKSEGARSYDKR
jgi:serine/threonine protein kinase